MKNFKSFVAEAGPNLKPKAKGEADFVNAHKVEITDIEDQEKEGSAKVVTKDGSGKRKADRLDNKQAMGEDVELTEEEILELDEGAKETETRARELADKLRKKDSKKSQMYRDMANQALTRINTGVGSAKQGSYRDIEGGGNKSLRRQGIKPAGKSPVFPFRKEEVELDEAEKKLFPGTPEYKAKFGTDKEKHELKYGKSDVKKITPYGYRDKDDKKVKEAKTYRKMMKEADFTKQQTKMAHTIGKEFEKKGVGDETRGGPYAVASAMVKDRPEAAKKAYKTIQSKMKEETDAELLFKLYNDLNEENQEFFMHQLEEDADSLLEFARMMEEE